ncbi:MAG: hypothetical protein LC808_04505 [Actinobacteria bacterium]|nr:hypothetical protein [Actinomycetota bacterium]
MGVHDGFPADTDPVALAVIAVVERARETGHEVTPLVRVRAAACGCGLGKVHRENGVTVLTGTVVARVLVGIVNGRDRYQERRQQYAVQLDNPDCVVSFGCEHGGTATGELPDDTLSRVRAAVAAATRRGVTLRV